MEERRVFLSSSFSGALHVVLCAYSRGFSFHSFPFGSKRRRTRLISSLAAEEILIHPPIHPHVHRRPKKKEKKKKRRSVGRLDKSVTVALQRVEEDEGGGSSDNRGTD